jgi:hypothetical protein
MNRFCRIIFPYRLPAINLRILSGGNFEEILRCKQMPRVFLY